MKALRNKIVETVYRAKEGHIASALSILDIVYVLYNEVKTADDVFILSKGHGCLAWYVVMEKMGLVSALDLEEYCTLNGILGGHPFPTNPEIVTATGSLGHGLPFGVGMALARRRLNRKGKVFVLVGDQECNEGTIWESALLAARHGLHNLIMIVDDNYSSKRSLPMTTFNGKFESFGWGVIFVNGHNHLELKGALSLTAYDRPLAIIARTIKGHGCKMIENDPNEWHHKIPSETEYNQLINE